MRRPLVQWGLALVECVHLDYLGRVGRRRKRHVSITSGVSEDLHLLIDPTEATSSRIGKRPVAVDESVPGRSFIVKIGEAAVPRQRITEVEQHTPCVLGGIRRPEAVMKVDLNL